jgi:hypothetical protein
MELEPDVVITQAVISYIVVAFIQWLKRAEFFPWLTIDTEKLNRAVGAFLALVTSAGILWTFDKDAGTLMISGLTYANGVTFLTHFVGQFVGQQYIFKTAFKPTQKAEQRVIDAANASK